MGEIAEMMLDGTLCQGCGVFLSEQPAGHPCCCVECAPDFDESESPKKNSSEGLQKQQRVKCTCGRWIAPRGMQRHIHDFHKDKPKPIPKPVSNTDDRDPEYRAAFEAWAAKQYPPYHLAGNKYNLNDGNRWYDTVRTQHAFEGFVGALKVVRGITD